MSAMSRCAKPVIKVYRLPEGSDIEQRRATLQGLVQAAKSIPELRIGEESDLVVVSPADTLSLGDDSPPGGGSRNILVEVDLPTHLVGRSTVEGSAVEEATALAIGRAVRQVYPRAYVQCKVYTFETRSGYWTSGADDAG